MSESRKSVGGLLRKEKAEDDSKTHPGAMLVKSTRKRKFDKHGFEIRTPSGSPPTSPRGELSNHCSSVDKKQNSAAENNILPGAMACGEQQERGDTSLDGSRCSDHTCIRIFPSGPRDNGETYWRCTVCGADS
eukprot:10971013-Karenia_brevis.AAC.1